MRNVLMRGENVFIQVFHFFGLRHLSGLRLLILSQTTIMYEISDMDRTSVPPSDMLRMALFLGIRSLILMLYPFGMCHIQPQRKQLSRSRIARLPSRFRRALL